MIYVIDLDSREREDLIPTFYTKRNPHRNV